MQRTLNPKLLLWTLGTLLVAGVGIHFLHEFQMRRNTGSLLERADRAQEAGDLDQALTYYTHYLASEPGDSAARAKFALVLDQHANNPGEWDDVVSTFKQVLERDPGRTDIRYRLVLNLIRLHRLREAMANVQSLLNSGGGNEAQRAQHFPGDADLEHILGWCQEASGDYLKAVAAFGRAIKLDPRRVDSYVLLAEVLKNRLGQGGEAGKVMDDLVQANEQSFRVYLIRCNFRRQQNLFGGAEEDLDKALALGPREPSVLLAAADWARSKRDMKKAQEWVEQAFAIEPGNSAVVKALTALEMRAGNVDGAAAILTSALKVRPNDQELHILLTELLIDQGKLANASMHIDELAEAGAPSALCAYLKGRLAIEKSLWSDALTYLVRASADLGASTEWGGRVHALLGLCYQQTGDYDKAVNHYLEGVALGDRQPRDLARLVQLLVHFKRFLEAQQVLEKAQMPLSPELAHMGAEIALANQNAQEAFRLATQAVSPASRDYRDYLWLGRIYHRTGSDSKSEEVLRQGVALAPDTPDTWIALAAHLARTGKRAEAQALAREAGSKVSPKLALFTEARCFAAIGLVEQAEALYRQAVAQDAEDFILLAHAADFFLQTDQPEKAEPYLTLLLKLGGATPAEHAVRARRQLALILAGKRSGELGKALALIDLNLQKNPNNTVDLRARALVQATLPSQRRNAIGVFEETARRRPLSADEQLQLAQLFEAEGDRLHAGAQIVALLTTAPENPQYLAFYIRHLIKDGDLGQARDQIRKLERLEPDSFRTLELKERLNATGTNHANLSHSGSSSETAGQWTRGCPA
ncbi:MAG TPA: tetratricopeptide repeat protein [Gemmataceae bacterium]|jgi:tetratricopeptide (TPR) repeat protein|nr:tetratricopeptide repeat protein [Gemmataceae bacterium]